MDISIGQVFNGFTLEKKQPLPEINGEALVFKHNLSRTRLLYLKNEDPNKAFAISFKTPPADDTGVFHILEHSVLNGSDKFPVKEPFVNLLKTSMQTFLNAMTFTDKTMYPVASTNSQDLLNLMDVYLDAVLHPAIYHKPHIFRQEGWHYEIDQEDGSIMVNGVVFNEMKGALSDPDDVLQDALQAELFPDTAYKFESGGAPWAIPSLSYEQFIDTHRRHYRLDNSYIILYGDLDPETFFSFLDKNYLTPCAQNNAECGSPNKLALQSPVIAKGKTCTMVTAPDNASCALGYVIGTSNQRLRLAAVDILLDALCGSNEAPLKSALLATGVANDYLIDMTDSMLQPYVSVQAKGLKDPSDESFLSVFEGCVRTLVEDGFDSALVEAAISQAEFVMREQDFGIADGVAYAISSMGSWLYDEDDPLSFIQYENLFKELRKLLDTTYYQDLLQDLFLDSKHMASVQLIPTNDEGEDRLFKLLSHLQDEIPEDKRTVIMQDVESLREKQETPDTPEAIAKLPQLTLADVGEGTHDHPYNLEKRDGLDVLLHQVPTNGISYANRYYNLNCLAWEDLPYASLLALMLAKLPTKSHSASQLDLLIQRELGNISFFTEVHENELDSSCFIPTLSICGSALSAKSQSLASLTDSILLDTLFDQPQKAKDVFEQKKLAMEAGFANNGHRSALNRASSYYSPAALVRQQLNGVDFYLFLKSILSDWEQKSASVLAKMEEVASTLFTDDNCLLSFGGCAQSFDEYLAEHLAANFPTASAEKKLTLPAQLPKKEAFIVPSEVTFSALGGYRPADDVVAYGSWMVAGRILSYDYLWNEVRVKGGAYGSGFQSNRSGQSRFYSYRDPHLDETIQRFKQAPDWLASFNPSELELEGYLVSTIASIDSPEKARFTIRRQDGWHLAKVDPDARIKARTQVVNTSVENLRAAAKVIEGICNQDNICVFGNKEVIEQSKVGFNTIALVP